MVEFVFNLVLKSIYLEFCSGHASVVEEGKEGKQSEATGVSGLVEDEAVAPHQVEAA